MSKSKASETETTNEVTENLIEQSELDGIKEETKTETVSTKSATTRKLDIPVNTVPVAAVKAGKKMGVYKFLSLYPQNVYIETMLKLLYPHATYTKEQWFERIDEILAMPLN